MQRRFSWGGTAVGIVSYDQFQRTDYFKVLDGWRAVSILLVLMFHSARFSGVAPLQILQENGRYGVSLFFAISGFIITTLLLREKRYAGQISLRKFYARRALRLLPLYYLVLLVETILIYVFNQYSPDNQELFREKFPSYLLYYSNWLKTSGVGPFFYSWSLAAEEQFYIVFGVLICWCRPRIIAGAALAAWLVKACVFQFIGPVDADSTVWRVAFSYQEPILMGVLAAFLLNHRQSYEKIARLLGSTWALAGLLIALAASLCVVVFAQESALAKQGLFLLMILAIIASVIRPAVPLLQTKQLTYLGKISYGMYLLHMLVAIPVRKYFSFSPAFSFLATVGGVSILAAFSYRYFESPIIAFAKQRFFVRQKPPLPTVLENIRPEVQPAFARVAAASASATPQVSI